jgi:hypothetical protein
MATATKQKTANKDLDKDVQALMELQDKLGAHAGLRQMVRLLCQRAVAAPALYMLGDSSPLYSLCCRLCNKCREPRCSTGVLNWR